MEGMKKYSKIEIYRKNYIELNRNCNPILIFHLGADAGFFSEYNNMILAMLYCLEHKIQFKLYSCCANFKIEKGWIDFFEPFCEEVYDIFHSKYNYRYPIPSFYELLKSEKKSRFFMLFKWKLKYIFNTIFVIPILKKKYKFDLFTYEIFDKMRSNILLQNHFYIPELGIDGSLQDACQRLIEITWIYKKSIKCEIYNIISSIKLPDSFIGLHIRSGDKYLESNIYSLESYMNKVQALSDEQNLFILTDDYSIIEELNARYKDYHVFTLCEVSERGYFHSSFCKENIDYKKYHLLKLFASVEIISSSKLFVGTYSSNPGMYLGCRIQERMYGIDRDKWFIM